MILIEITDFKALINNKPFFDQPVKNKQEEHEKLIIKMSKNDDYTGKFLDFLYHQKLSQNLISIDLSKLSNTGVPQKNQFHRKIRRRWSWNNVFHCWKAAKNKSKFFFRFIIC